MQPNIHINYLAILIAVAANFIFGFLWYTPLFGKIWAKEMGFSKDTPVPKSAFIKALVLNLFGNFLLAWVLSHNISVWYPSTWGYENPPEIQATGMAMAASIFTWLGFFVPVDLNTIGWEMKSWKLFLINTTYHLISLIIVAQIIAHMM